MEIPANARATTVARVRGSAARVTDLTTAAWHDPRRRCIALALAVAAAAAFAFAHIAEDYLTNDPLARWDVSFARWLAGERSAVGTDAFSVLTFLGSPPVVIAIAAVACVVLYRRRELADAALLPLVLVGTELLNLVLKLSFHRPRPEVAFVHLDTYSFPSGHAMASTAAYGALAYIAWGRLPTRGAQVLMALGAAVLVGLICFSRLYLGVHYLSDVLAGIAGGAFWLAVSIAIRAAWGHRLAELSRSPR